MKRAEGHRTASRLLAAVAVLLAVLALVLSYAGRAVLRSVPFADRATAALRDSAVQADVADHLANGLVQGNGDLIAVRPLIRSVAGAIVGSPAFAAVFHRAVLEAHQAVVEKQRPKALLNVTDATVLIQGVLQRLAPKATATTVSQRVVKLLTVQPPAAVRDVVDVARGLYKLAWLFGAAAILCALCALWLSAHPAACGRQIGIGLVGGGLLVVAIYIVGLAVVQQTAPSGRGPAAGAVWRVLAGGLRTQALWMAGAGAVVAGAASAWLRATEREGQPVGWRGALAPLRNSLSSGWIVSLLAVVVGVAILLEPTATLNVAAIAAGLLILGLGVAGLAARVTASAPAATRAAHEQVATASRRARRGVRVVIPVAVAVLALAGASVVIASGGGDGAPAPTSSKCNGYAALCGRRLNQVAFPATHNSFGSVTIPNFLFGQQDGTIADQLRFGIRGLLIDTYYGFSTQQRVRTDTTSLPERKTAIAELGEPAVKAAESIRDRLGSQPTGARGIYLCHGFCELGAVRLGSVLGDLRTFLLANPGEVVIIVNQDEGVTPADIAAAFHQAGLDPLIYRGSFDHFPTLGDMVDSDQRIVVMAENNADDISWYPLAYQHALQETPFKFKSTEALTAADTLANTCKPNRGPSSAPLFLLNNWVDTTPVPRPSNASVVNGYATLLHRAQTCERIRHRLANLVAVDFYRHGDVLGVARTLNGLTG
ncbi:MAG: hypothetical protein JO179_10650 [Solirubrobacterales bacterium]|nr:hypothetical protein [Solirubrobacterales bacterium]